MRCCLSISLAVLCLWTPPAAAWTREEAQQVAREYQQELKARLVDPPPPTATSPSAGQPSPSHAWQLGMDIRGGVATYQEKAEGLNSDVTVAFPEAVVTLSRQTENDVKVATRLAVGQSVQGTERWAIDGHRFQTNDVDFFQLDSETQLGKVLHSERFEHLQLIPRLDYGYRYTKFTRNDFNILNLVTIRDAVTESVHVHRTGCGMEWDYGLSPHVAIEGDAFLEWVFFNQANNSALGSVRGHGGRLWGATAGLRYSMGSAWQVLAGGFANLQHLRGGTKDDVLWPNNNLNDYGGDVTLRYSF